jgi:hypothetical protein
MVAHFGRYDKITPEAWAGFDNAMADWKAARGIADATRPLSKKGK